jgi:hypothetical protein
VGIDVRGFGTHGGGVAGLASGPAGLVAALVFGPAKGRGLTMDRALGLFQLLARQSLGLERPSGLTPAPATANGQCHQSALLQLAEKVACGDVLELAGG